VEENELEVTYNNDELVNELIDTLQKYHEMQKNRVFGNIEDYDECVYTATRIYALTRLLSELVISPNSIVEQSKVLSKVLNTSLIQFIMGDGPLSEMVSNICNYMGSIPRRFNRSLPDHYPDYTEEDFKTDWMIHASTLFYEFLLLPENRKSIDQVEARLRTLLLAEKWHKDFSANTEESVC
jgi:hypothetical protein